MAFLRKVSAVPSAGPSRDHLGEVPAGTWAGLGRPCGRLAPLVIEWRFAVCVCVCVCLCVCVSVCLCIG